MRAWVDASPALAGDRPACGTAASSSATGSTRPRRRTSPAAAAGRPGTSSRPPTSPARRELRRATPPRCSAEPTTPRATRALAERGRAARSAPSTSRRPAGMVERRADRLRAGARVRPAADAAQRAARRRAAGRAGRATAATASAPASSARRSICDALTDAGHARRRLPPAAAARVPVVAVPGDDGRDDDLGALGQHAARRHDQPRRDDLVQPLRARRGRRLAAPDGGGLAPAAPGYARLRIAPRPLAG